MSSAEKHVEAIKQLAEGIGASARQIEAGMASLAALLGNGGGSWSAPQETRDAMAAVIRALYGPMTQSQWSAIEAVLDGSRPGQTPAGQIGLTRDDFEWAIAALALTGNGYAKIRAVDEIESGGGWFTDVRADILALDGPGGFLSGPNLPKILFEAHWFDRLTSGRWRSSHPNISSAKWNRSLYVGGQGEYARLHQAMQLDETAALKSASWGRYQIMGFNHEKAGFDTVQEMVAAAKESERRHLEMFVAFIKSEGLRDELNAVSASPRDWRAFTRRYNGSGQVDAYSAKGAAAYRKFA